MTSDTGSPFDEAVTVVDAFGLACPQPVIALARAAAGLPEGARIDLLSDDPAADADVAAWCRMKSAKFLGMRPQPPGRRYLVRLGRPKAGGNLSNPGNRPA